MARGELLRKLILTYRRGNEDAFRAAALEVIAEEQRKSNHVLAKDLLRILDNGGPTNGSRPAVVGSLSAPPKDRERQMDLVDTRQPTRAIRDILLGKQGTAAVERILHEYRRADLLRVHGLRPSTKLLFCGPPGCGKTLCSEVIASELGLPLLYTRFDAIVSSYLGETSANLRKVFEYAARGRWVVLLDEFDAIGKARDDITEHGELKRVINSFLQLLDGFTAPSIVIAATNHEHLLDPALWRRFDEILLFPRPTVHEIRSLLEMKLRNFPHDGLVLNATATRLRGISHADVERICLDAIKATILLDKDRVGQEVFERAIAVHESRVAVGKTASSRRKS